MTDSLVGQSTFANFPLYVRHHVIKYWPWYLSGSAALAGTTFVTIQIPQLAKSIVNLIAAGDSFGSAISKAREFALLVVGLGFLQMIIRAMSRILIFWPGRKLETSSKDIIFSSALRIADRNLRKFGMGDLVSRIANDVGHLRVFFAFGILQIANLIFLSIFVITKMFQVHPGLAGACLVPLAGTFLVFRIVMPRLHKFSLENQAALGRLTNRVTEAFVNFHVIAACGAQEAFVRRTDGENEKVYATNIQVLMLRMVAFPLMTCLAGLSQLVVLFYGGLQVQSGQLSVGDILAFNVYIGLLSFPLTAMGIIAAVFQRAKTALTRLAEIDGAPKEGDDSPVSYVPPTRTPSHVKQPFLEIRSLSHSYGGKTLFSGNPFELSALNFTMSERRKIGVFGAIGSGKSTLFNLITRIIEPPAGTVFLNGVDVVSMTPQVLRAEIAYGMQSVHLFSDTIRANITFGIAPTPSQLQIEKACEQAQILAEINGFEHSWDTQIGEKGLRLSGGQKQRLALARIFLRKPKLMLLDDVLSAVDQSTESALMTAIFAQNSALLMASHRPSALKLCDEIIVMRNGILIDRGTYDELSLRLPDLAEESETRGPA